MENMRDKYIYDFSDSILYSVNIIMFFSERIILNQRISSFGEKS